MDSTKKTKTKQKHKKHSFTSTPPFHISHPPSNSPLLPIILSSTSTCTPPPKFSSAIHPTSHPFILFLHSLSTSIHNHISSPTSSSTHCNITLPNPNPCPPQLTPLFTLPTLRHTQRGHTHPEYTSPLHHLTPTPHPHPTHSLTTPLSTP